MTSISPAAWQHSECTQSCKRSKKNAGKDKVSNMVFETRSSCSGIPLSVLTSTEEVKKLGQKAKMSTHIALRVSSESSTCWSALQVLSTISLICTKTHIVSPYARAQHYQSPSNNTSSDLTPKHTTVKAIQRIDRQILCQSTTLSEPFKGHNVRSYAKAHHCQSPVDPSTYCNTLHVFSTDTHVCTKAHIVDDKSSESQLECTCKPAHAVEQCSLAPFSLHSKNQREVISAPALEIQGIHSSAHDFIRLNADTRHKKSSTALSMTCPLQQLDNSLARNRSRRSRYKCTKPYLLLT